MKFRGTPQRPIILLSSATLAFLFFVALVSCAASAHRPIIEDRDASGYDKAIYIPDPDVSRAIYGFLDQGDNIDFYAFDVLEFVDRSR